MDRPTRVPLLIILLFFIDFLLAALYLTTWGMGEPSWKVTKLFDLDGEANIPAWYSSSQMFLSAIFLAGAAPLFSKNQKHLYSLWLLSLAFLAMSMDEVAQIHEWLGKRADIFLPEGSRENTFFQRTGIWMFVLGIPVLSGFLFLLTRLWGHLRNFPRAAVHLSVGIALFFGSALLIEGFSNLFLTDSDLYILQVCLEELGEMLGITFVLWGGFDLLVQRFPGIYPSAVR